MSTNSAERAMRCVAIGRKNWLALRRLRRRATGASANFEQLRAVERGNLTVVGEQRLHYTIARLIADDDEAVGGDELRLQQSRD